MAEKIEDDLIQACDVISSAQVFLLTCHVNPDGDALGSMLAMAHALISIDKQVFITIPDPFIIPESLSLVLPGIKLIQEAESMRDKLGSCDVAMTFDCGSKTRLEGLEDLLSHADIFINIDHHLGNERFGDINVVDPNAASSGSVVLNILDACSIELTQEVAQCIYVALLTDTGRFQFSSTTPDVFAQAQRLSSFNLPIAQLSRILTEEDSYALLKLAGHALTTMMGDKESNVVSVVVSRETQKDYGVEYHEIDSVIEFVRRAREYDVACVVKELIDDDYRVSLRSLGDIDVCKIAQSFAGGGHRYAAGFSSTQKPEEIIKAVQNEVKNQRGQLSE